MSQLPTVTIPALPIGNIAAVVNMVRKVGGKPILTSDPQELYMAQRVILAGVGAFDAGMNALEKGGWIDPLNALAAEGKVHILGICLGMQLMCRSSEEGILSGLGWFDADVKRIIPPLDSTLKVPHMGWNTLDIKKRSNLLGMYEDELRFYFVHSYHVVCDKPSDIVASTNHGFNLTAAIGRGNLHGFQFHPEKSHRFGMNLMEKFLALSFE
jgi:imidazole glycerol-phosphate synthase subunit HisH